MVENRYRSIFHSPASSADAFQAATGEMRAWLGWKRYDLAAFDRGDSRIAPGVVLLHIAANSPDGAQTRNWRLLEGSGEGDWTVSLTVHASADPTDPKAATWFWTEAEFVPAAITGVHWVPRQRAGAPRLVRGLLGRVDGFDGPARFCAEPVLVGAERAGALIDVLCDPGRRRPAVVASANPAVSLDDWLAVIAEATREVAGLASVYLLDRPGTSVFSRAIGESHAVWDGELRTYLPDVDPAAAADGTRHRVLSAARIAANPGTSAMIISAAPRRLAAEAPLPAALARVSRTLLPQASSTPDTADVRTHRDHVEHLGRERDLALDWAAKQQDRVYALLAQRESALAELAERQQQVFAFENQVRALRRRLIATGNDDGANRPTDAQAAPPGEFAELIDWVEQNLPRVSFTGDIAYPLELDASPEAPTWVRNSWEAFRALESYAEGRQDSGFRGDFKAWCERPPSPDAYIISPGKVRPRESATVRNKQKLWQERIFPVPREIEASGRTYMEAHLVIGASSGGQINPRLYYLDAITRTGKVYVGYLGRHLTNTLS